MFGALTQITLREWQRHKLRLALTVLGISLGVAVFFAIRTANQTLVGGLSATIAKLAGKSTLQIVAGEAGFSQDILRRVRSTSGVQYAEPVVETFATTELAGGEKLLILGLDTSSELKIYSDSFDQNQVTIKNPLAFSGRSDSIALTRSFADRFSLKEGDRILVDVQSGRRELTIRGLFSASGSGSVFDGNVAVMDLAAAQDAFGRGNNIDRIDVANVSDVSVGDLQNTLTDWLPSGIKAVRPDLRGQSLENAVSSMNYGLTIMSFLALTIGIFIIFNSFSISLNQRWKEIGILRSLGVPRVNIQRMFLFEAALMGLIGSIIGVAIGFGLAKIAMRFVSNVTASFYGFVSLPQQLDFSFIYARQAIIAGLLTALVAAWLPARAAAKLDPALALHNIESRQPEYGISLVRLVTGFVCVSGGFLLVASVSANIGSNNELLYSFIMQLGMVLLVPAFTTIGARIIRPVMDRLFGAEGLIAIETMARSPRRTSSTVIALMIGLGFVFSYGAFIKSQKTAINRALDKAISADILVAASNEVHSRTYHFSEATANRIAAFPEIAAADVTRIALTTYGAEEILISAHDMNAYFAVSPDLLDFGDRESALPSTASGDGMLVSNNFAARWNVRLGDFITLDSPSGPLSLNVVGMLDYYRSEKGTVFIDRSLYKRYWGDSDVDYVFIDLKEGVDRTAFKEKVETNLRGEQKSFVYTHEEYKRWISGIVDQFFGLMYVQMSIAFFIASIGLVNTMVISVTERRRELGIFRAIGGLRRQVVKMILLEAIAISLIGLFVGTLAGILNAYFLVNAATRIVAGYTLPLIFPISMVLAAIPVVILVAVMSAWFPARGASRLNVVEAIGYE
jgi:putative ABC transport system permease protein